jgi:protein phosphatase
MTGPLGPTIDLERIKLVDDDRVLVCTNGLTDAVDEDSIARILSTDDTPAAHCRALVDLAVTAEADDDVTALVARYRIPS